LLQTRFIFYDPVFLKNTFSGMYPLIHDEDRSSQVRMRIAYMKSSGDGGNEKNIG
jgi:hypothetical protein